MVEGNDFNVGLFTASGDIAVAGPYVLTHVTTMDRIIKTILAETDPAEVRDGDVFLVNDPYMGALHQNDVAFLAPIYLDGRLAMWAGNVLHHADLGGIDEGVVGFVFDEQPPSESEAGEICVKRLLAGERGHYGALEHAQIVLNVGWFPHSVMQQARTHRVGVSFDVQSMRYTGDRICRAANGELDLEEVFYLRPVGQYSDRQGKKYSYTAEQRSEDLELCRRAAERYRDMLTAGFAEEHARGILPFDYRQHFVVSFSLRAFLHFMDLRAKLDAQEEIRVLCDLMWPHLQAWAPEIAGWYEKTRLHKARLAP